MSTKVVAKASAEERMGVVVSVDGRTEIIEYSDLPAERSRAVDAAGRLLLWAGNTAMHVFRRDFLDRLVQNGVDLPYHVAFKAVPYLDALGVMQQPDRPNAYKFEQFIFDALPLARNALVVEADRAAEFNPLKNRSGNDSPQTARAALVDNHRRWLEAAGAKVAEGAVVEISPLLAWDADSTRERVAPGTSYESDTVLEFSGEPPAA
jgi:UDP-N-acetylglucosamine/UDP-N-acetylgalactosamine diphosphorylase